MPNVVLLDVEVASWIDDALTKETRAVIRIPKGFGNNLR